MASSLLCLNGVKRQAEELQKRARTFLVRVSAFCETLASTQLSRRVIPQLIDAAGGASSNYNGACRARSKKEFAAKIGVAAEEASEALEWLLSLREARLGDPQEREALIQEAEELTAIFTSSYKTSSRQK